MKYAAFLNPKFIAFTGLSAMIVIAWAYLVMMSGHSMSMTGANSEMNYSVGLFASMWVAMSVAMMLPTAIPMISAYVQICQTATVKSIITVSPLVLIGGYLSVWLVFSISAAFIQVTLVRLSLMYSISPATYQAAASAVLIGAGIYQFSNLKHACLTKCRAPLNFFIANWSDRPREIFRHGLQQGLFCLGCCWALMLVMFVTGVMNIMWMVALTALMVTEKIIPKPDVLRRITGFALIAWGATLAFELL